MRSAWLDSPEMVEKPPCSAEQLLHPSTPRALGARSGSPWQVSEGEPAWTALTCRHPAAVPVAWREASVSRREEEKDAPTSASKVARHGFRAPGSA